jgi:hypothetical protein
VRLGAQNKFMPNNSCDNSIDTTAVIYSTHQFGLHVPSSIEDCQHEQTSRRLGELLHVMNMLVNDHLISPEVKCVKSSALNPVAHCRSCTLFAQFFTASK